MKLEFSFDATNDLDEIGNYTLHRYGLEQVEKYRAVPKSTIDAILRNPQMAVARTLKDYRKDVRYVRAGSHFIMYQIKAESILILRILHPKMDLISHLP